MATMDFTTKPLTREKDSITVIAQHSFIFTTELKVDKGRPNGATHDDIKPTHPASEDESHGKQQQLFSLTLQHPLLIRSTPLHEHLLQAQVYMFDVGRSMDHYAQPGAQDKR